MTVIDAAAVIGALSWVPQIFTWIQDRLAKPVVALFTGKAPEIGFCTFGTVLNLSVALSASVTDAAITRMEVELTHEKGQRFILPWMGLSESLAQVETTAGLVEHHKRQQAALALKVITDDLTEQTVLFQDADFQARIIEALGKVEDRRERVYAQNPHGVGVDLVLRSDEFAQLESTVREGFSWQVGSYAATFRIQVAERKQPFAFHFTFRLSETEVARLHDNIERLLVALRGVVDPSLAGENVIFNWRYPTMIASGKALSRVSEPA